MSFPAFFVGCRVNALEGRNPEGIALVRIARIEPSPVFHVVALILVFPAHGVPLFMGFLSPLAGFEGNHVEADTADSISFFFR